MDKPSPSKTALSRGILGRVLLIACGLLWASGIFFGAKTMLNYETAPASPGTPSVWWPLHTAIPRPQDQFTLVMFAHPDCPCTRASLAELEIVKASLPGFLRDSFVVFSKPGSTAAEALASELWKKAASIPGVTVLWDGHAVETERFGARVSGQTLLYDREGRLVFSGGLTSVRGHQGDNLGVDAVIRRVKGDSTAPAQFPVFGCSLHDPGADALSEDPSWKK
jgi:hypothetical protein